MAQCDVLEAESRLLLVMVVWRQERERERVRTVIEAVLGPGPLPSGLTAWLGLTISLLEPELRHPPTTTIF